MFCEKLLNSLQKAPFSSEKLGFFAVNDIFLVLNVFSFMKSRCSCSWKSLKWECTEIQAKETLFYIEISETYFRYDEILPLTNYYFASMQTKFHFLDYYLRSKMFTIIKIRSKSIKTIYKVILFYEKISCWSLHYQVLFWSIYCRDENFVSNTP